MKTIPWSDRLHYRFDNLMSKGTAALIAGLAVLSLVIILLAAAVISLLNIAPEGGEQLGFAEAAWESLMRTLDAGTMGGDTGWGFRLVMFAVTLGGVFIISGLIGVLTSGLETKMDELRKGRSRVIETGHTVILGWSAQVFSILSELVTANENQTKSCIVILGDRDKVEMEEEIRSNVGPTGRTRIVCRTGSPIDLNDLQLASLTTARAIIVLSPDKDNPDADVIKTILAITNAADRRPEPYHIVAEIRDPKNLEVARMVGQGEVEIVLVGDLISRIIAQTCRQSGLSVVYTELLDFGGDEIYFKQEPGLAGKTFGETLQAYEDSAVIGVFRAGGQVQLNPSMDYRLGPGDQVIAISADDDTISLSGLKDLHITESAIQGHAPVQTRPERTLILGWNWRAPRIIAELDHYVAPGSAVTLVSTYPDSAADIQRLCPEVNNQTSTCLSGDTTDRRTLDELGVETYDHIIVLSYDEHLEEQEADSLTLITLLHLRDMAERSGRDFTIVSEMLDIRNRALAEVTRADDFIVSDKLISLMLSQVAENKHLNAVFTDIFDPQGAEVYLKPVEAYVAAGVPLNFYTVVEAARRRAETAIGYRLEAEAKKTDRAYGVKLNPRKSDRITFSRGDKIVVIAED